MDEFLQIFSTNLPEADKIARGFDYVIRWMLQESSNQVELLKAANDQDALVKEQVKASTLKFARQIFNDCYRHATGRSAWDE